jgi:excisionase family DNA binding protein
MIEKRIATRREAAEFLCCSERKIDRMVQAGKLKSFKIGHGVRFWLADLTSLLQ